MKLKSMYGREYIDLSFIEYFYTFKWERLLQFKVFMNSSKGTPIISVFFLNFLYKSTKFVF